MSLLNAPLATAQHPPDHYLVYVVNFTPVSGAIVNLTDQFGSDQTQVRFLERFANPVIKNGEPMFLPGLHYSWWSIFVTEPPRNVLVSNQFGPNQDWLLGDSKWLLAPASKNGSIYPTDVNHYRCYDALGGLPLGITVQLEDQFRIRSAIVAEPNCLCTPVQKTHGPAVFPIHDQDAHLACYNIDQLSININVGVVDQFGGNNINLGADLLLCVPSQKGIPTGSKPSTWGTIKTLYR